jgi:hypothetical protein
MTQGDHVIVIDQESRFYGKDGQIGSFTVTGGVGVKIGGRVEVFDPHQLELAQLVTSLPQPQTGRSAA